MVVVLKYKVELPSFFFIILLIVLIAVSVYDLKACEQQCWVVLCQLDSN